MCNVLQLRAVLHTMQMTVGFFVLFAAVGKTVGLMIDPSAGVGQNATYIFWDWFRRLLWVFVMTSVGCFVLGRAFLNWIQLLQNDGVAQVWPFDPMQDLEPAVRQVILSEVLVICIGLIVIQVAFIVSDYTDTLSMYTTVDYGQEFKSFVVITTLTMILGEALVQAIRKTRVVPIVPAFANGHVHHHEDELPAFLHQFVVDDHPVPDLEPEEDDE